MKRVICGVMFFCVVGGLFAAYVMAAGIGVAAAIWVVSAVLAALLIGGLHLMIG